MTYSNIKEFIFSIEKNEKLETKIWFRFLRVINIIAYILIILLAIFIGLIMASKQTQIGAELKCNDGTTWNAKNQNYKNIFVELDTYEKCGLCNKRTSDYGSYIKCSLSEDINIFNSYTVNRQYKNNYNPLQVMIILLLFVVSALSLLKILIKGLIYIIVGKN